jgi:phosphopantothenoylcysteine decarboxylase / phosphopantothenate---cysteine ligase
MQPPRRAGMLASVRILLGVTGGIAAYKAAELVRLLTGRGHEVRVVMTVAATRFIGPLTLHALSGHPVHSDDSEATDAAMAHIELARWAEHILIAPASADSLARLRAGLANDLLASLCLAAAVPLSVAPAMNLQMWSAAATRENLAVLAARGVRILGPADGAQACGETGPGRMLEPAAIAAAFDPPGAAAVLAGLRVLVSAGPTREPIDPVRYIGNRSSGKMGYAVAAAARDAGASVHLVSGPVALQAPPGVTLTAVETAAEMAAEVFSAATAADIYIATAAVADYRVPTPATQKQKKSAQPLVLTLTPTVDILATLAAREAHPFLVGFAAETETIEAHAEAKRIAKQLDLIAVNQVGEPGQGFGAEENALVVLGAGWRRELPLAPKTVIARQLIDIIAEVHSAQRRRESA